MRNIVKMHHLFLEPLSTFPEKKKNLYNLFITFGVILNKRRCQVTQLAEVMIATGMNLPPEGGITPPGTLTERSLVFISLSFVPHEPPYLRFPFSPVLPCMTCIVRHFEQKHLSILLPWLQHENIFLEVNH